MIYNLLNPIELQQFKVRTEFLETKAKKMMENKFLNDMLVVEVKEKKPQRTIQQNKYLWVTITYVALEEGYQKDTVEHFFKDVNREIFQRTAKNKKGVEYKYYRHLSDLSMDEMSVAIDRWISHCASERGLYIPSPEDHYYLQWMHQVERDEELNKEYL